VTEVHSAVGAPDKAALDLPWHPWHPWLLAMHKPAPCSCPAWPTGCASGTRSLRFNDWSVYEQQGVVSTLNKLLST